MNIIGHRQGDRQRGAQACLSVKGHDGCLVRDARGTHWKELVRASDRTPLKVGCINRPSPNLKRRRTKPLTVSHPPARMSLGDELVRTAQGLFNLIARTAPEGNSTALCELVHHHLKGLF